MTPFNFHSRLPLATGALYYTKLIPGYYTRSHISRHATFIINNYNRLNKTGLTEFFFFCGFIIGSVLRL